MTIGVENDRGVPARKKPYETPRLETYGDIREIAKSLAITGTPDNGIMLLVRTG